MVTTFYKKNGTVLNINELSIEYPELIKSHVMHDEFVSLKTILENDSHKNFKILVNYDTNSIKFFLDVNR